MDQLKFTGSRYKAHQQHWQQYLSAYEEDFCLSQKGSPSLRTVNWDCYAFSLTEKEIAPLWQLVKGNDTGLFVGLLAALGIVLQRYSGRNKILIDSPLIKGGHSDVRYIHRVPLFLEVIEKQLLREQLQQLKETVKACYAYQNYPLAFLEPATPAYTTNVLIAHEAFHEPADLSGYGLGLLMKNGREGLRMEFHFRTDAFEGWWIKNLSKHLIRVLAYFRQTETPIQAVEILSPEEKRQLLEGFNQTTKPFPANQTVTQLIEAQVARTPEATAIVHPGGNLSYRQLNEKANQLAHYLRDQCAIAPQDLVGLMLDRSEKLMVGLLAILKAGAAYVPIDPAYPEDRRQYMMQDSGIKVLLTEGTETLSDAAFRTVSMQQADWRSYPAHNPVGVNQPDHLLYVIYTSGTTGRPKGVEVEHRSVVNLSHWLSTQMYAPQPAPLTVLLTASVNFDASVQQLFAPLINGAQLVLIPEATKKDPQLYLNALRAYGVDVIDITPAYLKAVLVALEQSAEPPPALKYTLVGGEALSEELVTTYEKICKGSSQLINVYGVTEAAVDSAFEVADRHRKSARSIGFPLPNTQLFILDSQYRPAPVGVAGELYIGGEGVARGYHHRTELTDEKFVCLPFAPQKRVYRTGDLARWQPDGSVEFLGRNDSQVKIRGYRIELEEIENVLLGHAEIDQALVEARADAQGEKQLIAYLVGKSQPKDIRQYLNGRLPEYMVPAYFVWLDALPLTPNGKIDRKALPAPAEDETWVAPQNALEEQLAGIWCQVLGRERISADANFFEIGGHSLKATQVVTQVYKELGLKLELRSLFSHPVLSELAKVIAEIPQERYQPIEPVAAREYYEASHAQKRLWIVNQLEDTPIAYNIADAKWLEGPLNHQAFGETIQTLVERHEILRTSFAMEDGVLMQQIHAADAMKSSYEYLDLSPSSGAAQQADVLVQQSSLTPFDLGKGPLMRIKLIRLQDEVHLLVCTLHHIISDGWSVGILMKELFTVYQTHAAGESPDLSPLRVQYKEYAAWHNLRLQSQELEPSRLYWQKKFAAPVPALPLPLDFGRSDRQTFNGQTLRFQLEATTSHALQKLSQQSKVTLFTTLMTCVKVWLYRYTGEGDIVIGSPVAGRIHPDLENQLGFYVNTLPIRDGLQGEDTFHACLQKVNQTVIEAFQHQAYPFDQLVEGLDEQKSRSRSSLFDVMLMLQNFESGAVKLDSVKVSDYPIESRTSKFDLLLCFQENSDGLALDIEFNSDLFKPERIQRGFAHLTALMESAIEDPFATIDDLDLMSRQEKESLLSYSN